MNRKTVTLKSIINKEKRLVMNASLKYGNLNEHVLRVGNLIETFFSSYIGTFDAGADLFLRFYTELRNFYMLTHFSTVRLHSDQANLDLRRMTETCCNLAYSIANPNYKDFVDTDEFGILDPSQDLKEKRNKWLKENYPDRSNDLLKIKVPIQTIAHSNLISTYKISKHVIRKNKPIRTYTSFFDKDDEYLTSIGLWQLANAGLACLGLIYEVNRDHNKIKFIDNYEIIHSELLTKNLAIRDLYQNLDRFKKTRIAGRTKVESNS